MVTEPILGEDAKEKINREELMKLWEEALKLPVPDYEVECEPFKRWPVLRRT